MKKNISIDQLIDLVLKESNKKDASIFSTDIADQLRDQVYFYRQGQANSIPSPWEKFLPDLTEEELKSREHSVQFEYCECGCKCHSATSKGVSYSIYNSLQGDKSLSLVRGHGRYGFDLGKFSNWYEAVVAAQKDFDSIP